MKKNTYSIVHVPHKILEGKTRDINDPLTSEIQELIPQMFDIMHQARGIGLAATQIGLDQSITVIELDKKRYVLINPMITSASEEKILFTEGCLSIPGKEYSIVRSERVTARYLDENGKKCKLKASGLLAIVLQHEIDHLDGTVILDRHNAQKKLRTLFM